jgi:hypothetical protein
MLVMALDVKLDLSMRIERQGDIAEVAIAAEVSIVAAEPCAEDEVSQRSGLYVRGARAEKC